MLCNTKHSIPSRSGGKRGTTQRLPKLQDVNLTTIGLAFFGVLATPGHDMPYARPVSLVTTHLRCPARCQGIAIAYASLLGRLHPWQQTSILQSDLGLDRSAACTHEREVETAPALENAQEAERRGCSVDIVYSGCINTAGL